MLIEARRVTDRLDQLAEAAQNASLTVANARGDQVAQPLFVEARQQGITLIRLPASLRLPSGDEGDLSQPPRRGGARGSYGIRGAVGS
ncbi:hypothetical protein [Pseudactinotalea terrae]|uniref:hypothetical protein n=1 Tax=Pseudactinotalea terrae TaxID=1743262 RepID=UPI0012E300F7|nr:hypothetical protein [Pseudactinotalea terrae]